MPKPCARCVANTSSSTNEPSSSSISMRSRAVALPVARRLFAAAVSACNASYRRLRYWLIFCSETVVAMRSGASTPSIAGAVRRTGVRLFGLRAAIRHMVGAVLSRLRQAAAEILSRPALYWALAGVFWLRVVVLSALVPRRPDAEGMWEGAHAFLTDPTHMYDAAAAFVSPPPVAALAIPVALLPRSVGVEVWTVIDALALVGGLLFLYRTLAIKHRIAKPAFWLVAAYFPPLLADVSAGQRGGVLLLGAMASIWLESRRPSLAGAVGGLVAALKYYPAAMFIGTRPAHRIRYAAALAAVVV